jgi:hypothetical protein
MKSKTPDAQKPRGPIEKQETPVFCSKCKFSRGLKQLSVNGESCEYPDNFYYENNYDEPKKQYKSDPSRINKWNDCKWYKRGW